MSKDPDYFISLLESLERRLFKKIEGDKGISKPPFHEYIEQELIPWERYDVYHQKIGKTVVELSKGAVLLHCADKEKIQEDFFIDYDEEEFSKLGYFFFAESVMQVSSKEDAPGIVIPLHRVFSYERTTMKDEHLMGWVKNEPKLENVDLEIKGITSDCLELRYLFYPAENVEIKEHMRTMSYSIENAKLGQVISEILEKLTTEAPDKLVADGMEKGNRSFPDTQKWKYGKDLKRHFYIGSVDDKVTEAALKKALKRKDGPVFLIFNNKVMSMLNNKKPFLSEYRYKFKNPYYPVFHGVPHLVKAIHLFLTKILYDPHYQMDDIAAFGHYSYLPFELHPALGCYIVMARSGITTVSKYNFAKQIFHIHRMLILKELDRDSEVSIEIGKVLEEFKKR